MSLDPDFAEMRRLGHLAVDLVVEHLATLADARVAQRYASADLRQRVREPLPRAGSGAEPALRHFFTAVLPHATYVHHPRFFAYVPGPGSYIGALGAFVAAATNSFVGTWLGGAAMAQLELEVLDWLRQALGLPPGFDGILTTGGSMANLGALAAARARAGNPVHGAVYTSDEAHYSVAKAARVLGIAHVRCLPTDEAQRLVPGEVAAAIAADRAAGLQPTAVCASAGTTSTGAIDPLPDLAALCHEQQVWFHVDGAYGAPFALLAEGRRWLDGMALADSITLDPHKGLYAPFECGCLLTRDVEALRRAFTADAQYLQDVPRDEVNFFERGPELSRGNRALKLWLLLRACGVDALATAIAQDVRLCRLACDLLAADPRLEIVTPPSLSVFSFAVRHGNGESQALLERILADGFTMLSSSRVRGRFVLRVCVLNHRTDEAQVRAACARIRALVA